MDIWGLVKDVDDLVDGWNLQDHLAELMREAFERPIDTKLFERN